MNASKRIATYLRKRPWAAIGISQGNDLLWTCTILVQHEEHIHMWVPRFRSTHIELRFALETCGWMDYFSSCRFIGIVEDLFEKLGEDDNLVIERLSDGKYKASVRKGWDSIWWSAVRPSVTQAVATVAKIAAIKEDDEND